MTARPWSPWSRVFHPSAPGADPVVDDPPSTMPTRATTTPPAAPMAPVPERHTAHCPQGHRVLPEAGPPPLDRGADGGLAGRLSPPAPSLRAQGGVLPGLRRNRCRLDLLPPARPAGQVTRRRENPDRLRRTVGMSPGRRQATPSWAQLDGWSRKGPDVPRQTTTAGTATGPDHCSAPRPQFSSRASEDSHRTHQLPPIPARPSMLSDRLPKPPSEANPERSRPSPQGPQDVRGPPDLRR